MTVKGTQGFSPDQFWDTAGLPSADACRERPDIYGRYLFNPSHIKEIVEVATFGGTHYTGWTLTPSDSSEGGLIKTTPGTMILDSESATADHGPFIQREEPILTVVAGEKYGMLARYKVADNYAQDVHFVGLAEVLTALHGSNDFDSKDFIGFGHELTLTIASDTLGAWFVCSGADATPTVLNTGVATGGATGAFMWVGFVCEGATWAKAWHNGIWSPTTVTTTLPDAATTLYPSVDVLSEGTSDPIIHLTHMEFRWEHDMAI